MTPEQEKRYQKLRTEQFYLLGHDIDTKTNMNYHISGSTRNIYKVTIYQNGKIFCTCPDAKSWAVKKHCICKHSLFILYRVLTVFDRTDHPFFDRLVFTPEELECVVISTQFLQGHLDNTIVNNDLSDRFKNLVANVDSKVAEKTKLTIRFDAEDVCGVCFLEMENDNDEKYAVCPKCNKAAHNDCIQKWISSKQYLCVYCRQDVWRGGVNGHSSRQDGDYKNLGY